MTWRNAVLHWGVLPFLLGGCLSIHSEGDLMVLERRRHDLRAVTSDDARLRVREFRNLKGGDLVFWSSALRNDLVQGRGYTLLEERKVADVRGREGQEYVFGVNLNQAPHRYLVRVSLVKRPMLLRKFIRVTEFLAPTDVFERHLETIRAAMDGIGP